ncbi:MAG: flavohemoglobin expression-modulating QEGLA motif protein [Gammaproteobacteria bacterium]
MPTKKTPKKLTAQQKIIYALSERIVKAQTPIRILNAIKWEEQIYRDFVSKKCKELPKIKKEYYDNIPLNFAPEEKREEFYQIERDIKRQLGQFNGIGKIMLRMCREYRAVVRMLEARGNKEFSDISKELYGSSNDAFYANGPLLIDLAVILSQSLQNIGFSTETEADQKNIPTKAAATILQKKLDEYFHQSHTKVNVMLSDGIVSDAAAGADKIKLRKGTYFSQRDLELLAVHEGWVHIGTTLNGMTQPVCTFLSKGPPSSTIYQEGLAVLMEIITFTSHPKRITRLARRIQIINLAENGADFLDIFHYLRELGCSIEESYLHTSRIFRGCTAKSGAFTKDLSYSKGFILIYNYVRLAIKNGLLNRIALLFLGKTTLEDLAIYENLLDDGTIVYPQFIPPQFSDLAGLACWMCYSLFLNQLSLEKLTLDYKTIL